MSIIESVRHIFQIVPVLWLIHHSKAILIGLNQHVEMFFSEALDYVKMGSHVVL